MSENWAYAPNTRKRKPLLTPTPVRRKRPVVRDDDGRPTGWVKGTSQTDTRFVDDDISEEEIDRRYEAHLAYLRSQRGRMEA